LADFVARIADDFFGYVALFQSAPDAQRPAPMALRSHLLNLLERFKQDAHGKQISADEVALAEFALVAWADEMILSDKWPGSDEWRRQPLQLVRFNTVRAGNEFFEKLRTVGFHQDHALEIFYYCLVLGFQGELVTEPERRSALIADLYNTLYGKRRVLSPLEPPELSGPAYSWQFTDQQAGGRRVAPIVAWLVAGVVVFYVMCWGILQYAARQELRLPGGWL